MLDLVHYSNPILTEKAQDFDFANPFMPAEELANIMLTVMGEQNGIGLAANQIGLPYNVFVLAGDPYACFNPKIVDTSDEQVLLDEGCLTYPALYVKIKRPKSIRLRFTNIKGETETHKYTGMTARIVQHEMDHLAGKLFYNRASKFHKDQAFRKHNLYKRDPMRFHKSEIVHASPSTAMTSQNGPVTTGM